MPESAGFNAPSDLRHRLLVLCDAYGLFTPSAVIDAVFVVQQVDIERIRKLGALGVEPWPRFLADGLADGLEQQLAWLRSVRDKLL